MYSGNVTKELELLYSEYEAKFGYSVSGILDLEYSADDYNEYLNDIKKSIRTGVQLPDLYPDYDDEF